MNKLLPILLCAAAVNSLAAEPLWDTFADTWVATDALGRALPTNAITGHPKPNKTVGIFYFTWLGQHDHVVYDISKILAANPTDPQWGPAGRFHFWGQPLFGYYQSADEFVIRKHAQMLTDAGVDVIILDVTNASTYRNVCMTICKVYDDIRKAASARRSSASSLTPPAPKPSTNSTTISIRRTSTPISGSAGTASR